MQNLPNQGYRPLAEEPLLPTLNLEMDTAEVIQQNQATIEELRKNLIMSQTDSKKHSQYVERVVAFHNQLKPKWHEYITYYLSDGVKAKFQLLGQLANLNREINVRLLNVSQTGHTVLTQLNSFTPTEIKMMEKFIEKSDAAGLKELLRRNPALAAYIPTKGPSLLNQGIASKNIEIVHILLTSGVQVDEMSIKACIDTNNLKILSMVLDAIPEKDKSTYVNNEYFIRVGRYNIPVTPVMHVLHKKNYGMAKMLMEKCKVDPLLNSYAIYSWVDDYQRQIGETQGGFNALISGPIYSQILGFAEYYNDKHEKMTPLYAVFHSNIPQSERKSLFEALLKNVTRNSPDFCMFIEEAAQTYRWKELLNLPEPKLDLATNSPESAAFREGLLGGTKEGLIYCAEKIGDRPLTLEDCESLCRNSYMDERFGYGQEFGRARALLRDKFADFYNNPENRKTIFSTGSSALILSILKKNKNITKEEKALVLNNPNISEANLQYLKSELSRYYNVYLDN